MTSNDLQTFVRLHGKQDFPHRDKLKWAIEENDVYLHYSPLRGKSSQTCGDYLHTYKTRLKFFIQRYGDAAGHIIPETRVLCQMLEKTPDDPCELWIFKFSSGDSLCLFENANTRTIIGSLFNPQDPTINESDI